MSILHVPQGIDGAIHQHCEDGDIDNAAISQVCEYASAAQIAAADLIQIDGSEAADTSQKVTIIGVDSAGRRVIEEISLNGTTAVDSANTYKYVENAYLDTVTTGTVTIQRKTGPATLNQIAIGVLSADVMWIYPGDDHIVKLYGWWAGAVLSDEWALFELRWYPDAGAAGYRVMDKISVDGDADAVGPSIQRVTFPSPLRIPEGGKVCIFGKAESADNTGTAGMQFLPSLTKRIDNVQT